MSDLCGKHAAEYDKWLMYQGPATLGIKIAQSGYASGSISKTGETLALKKKYMATIKQECADGDKCSDEKVA